MCDLNVSQQGSMAKDLKDLINKLEANPKDACVVYCATKANTEEVAALLQGLHILIEL